MPGLWVPRSAVTYWTEERRDSQRRSEEAAREAHARAERLKADPWCEIRSASFNVLCDAVLEAIRTGLIDLEEVKYLASIAFEDYMGRQFDEYTGGAYFHECHCEEDY